MNEGERLEPDIKPWEGVRFLGRVGATRDGYALVFTKEALERTYKAVKESRKRHKRR